MQITKHANIIEFVGFSPDIGLILTELAHGSLHDVLHKELRFVGTAAQSLLGSAQKLQWLLEIALALRYLHFHGIIHRDIKPQNVLMVHDALHGRVVAKVGDFGISRAVGMSTLGSKAGACGCCAAGSAAYLAPELIDFDTDAPPVYTSLIDMYSYGVLANEALREEVPWSGYTVRQL